MWLYVDKAERNSPAHCHWCDSSRDSPSWAPCLQLGAGWTGLLGSAAPNTSQWDVMPQRNQIRKLKQSKVTKAATPTHPPSLVSRSWPQVCPLLTWELRAWHLLVSTCYPRFQNPARGQSQPRLAFPHRSLCWWHPWVLLAHRKLMRAVTKKVVLEMRK